MAVGVITKRLLDSAFAFVALVLGWMLAPTGDPTITQLAMFALYGLIALAILKVRG